MTTTYAIRAFGGTLIFGAGTSSARDIASRTLLQAVHASDIGTRLVLLAAPPSSGNALVPLTHLPITPFSGVGGALPVLVPIKLPYAVNGTPLDTQPGICTAPLASSPVIPKGSPISLTFSSPSSATQTALTNGTVVTLRFALADGSPLSGPVSVSSTLTGSTFVCFLVTTQDIPYHF